MLYICWYQGCTYSKEGTQFIINDVLGVHMKSFTSDLLCFFHAYNSLLLATVTITSLQMEAREWGDHVKRENCFHINEKDSVLLQN